MTQKNTTGASKVYGYCRVSTRHQKLDRQISNIQEAYPDAEIISEKYTGTSMQRPKWNCLFKKLAPGDTVVFDEVSRMSRDAEEGFQTYQELFTRGVTMVFLKEPHINSDTYRAALDVQMPPIPVGGKGKEAEQELMDGMRTTLNKYFMRLAERQIKIAFDQAQKEVDFLHKRIKEGMERASAGDKIAQARTGNTYETKKSREMKPRIYKMSRDFAGTMTDKEIMEALNLARNSYYKYKREMFASQDAGIESDTDE